MNKEITQMDSGNHEKMLLVTASPDLQPLTTFIAVGRSDVLEEQLITKSLQPHIKKYTPNDSKTRFCSHAAFENWIAKDRTIHWLVGPNNDLAGIIWYGKKAFPLDIALPETPTETFAVRLYENYAGHGLAVPFILQSLSIATSLKRKRGEGVAGVWLETGTDNQAALAVYSAIGCKELTRDEHRVTLVLPAARISEITDQNEINHHKVVGKQT